MDPVRHEVAGGRLKGHVAVLAAEDDERAPCPLSSREERSPRHVNVQKYRQKGALRGPIKLHKIDGGRKIAAVLSQHTTVAT